MTQHLIIEIFRSSKQDEMYLYVEKSIGLKDIPEQLMTAFGKGTSVMTMLLKKDTKLAQTTPEKVMASIREKGFYLQMPPAKDEYLLDLYKTPTQAVY